MGMRVNLGHVEAIRIVIQTTPTCTDAVSPTPQWVQGGTSMAMKRLYTLA